MAIPIIFIGKYVYFGDNACLHTQGESRAETYDIIGPRYHDGRDLSELTWYVRASHPNYSTIINKQISVSISQDDEDKIVITWPIDADFMAYPGKLEVQFSGKSENGEEIIKLQSDGLSIVPSVEGTAAPPKNMFESALEQITDLANDAANAAAQSKADADRAEQAQSDIAHDVQEAQYAVADVAQSVEEATALVEQIEGDADSAAQSAHDAADSAAMSKDWAAGKPVTYSGAPVSIAYAGAQRIASITAYGENAQGGTTEAPVALTGVDSVHVCGRNLLPKATETKTLNGVTFTPNPDGSVSVSGTATNNAAYVFANGLDDSLFGQTVCLSGGSMQTQLIINEKKPSGEWLRNVITNAKTPTAVGVLSKQVDDNILYGTIYVPTGTTVNTTIYPMLNLGNTAMPYEPYQGSVTPLPIPRPLRRVGDVKDKCVTRQDYESAEKLVVTYNVGFVELDGTEAWQASSQTSGMFFITRDNISAAAAICSNFNFSKSATTEQGKFYIVSNQIRFLTSYETLESWKNYLAAQKAEGTPVQIAYQLAAPEVYATDPLTIDNAAGPLNVMTGGELEVRMTELVGTRSDVSNNTVAFTEAAQDADISSGEKLSVLFGKIKKRFAVIAYNLSNIYNKTESDERYATAAQGEKADNALPKTGGTISGNLTVVQDLTVQHAFNGMRIKAGTKTITTPTTSARAELFNSDTLNELFGTTGVTYTNVNCVVMASNGDYDFHPRVVTSGYVNSKWAVFTADAGNFTISTMRVNYIAIKFA